MSLALHEAALEAGIALTLLPVVYMQAGVDGSPLAGAQRRFALDPDGWVRLAGDLEAVFADDPNRSSAWRSIRSGRSPRRRSPPPWRQAPSQPGDLPIHIHLAEQPKEVRDCLDRFDRRPLALLDRCRRLDHRWCLVHGTHLTDAEELSSVTERQAVIGLCPTTEADLGDGIFPLAEHLALAASSASARTATWPRMPPPSCGCSSRASASRSATGRGGEPRAAALRVRPWERRSTGRRQGRRPTGRPHRARLSRRSGGARPRAPQPDRPRSRDARSDSQLFAPGSAVRDVMVGGAWSLRDGHHAAEANIARSYRRAMHRLLA